MDESKQLKTHVQVTKVYDNKIAWKEKVPTAYGRLLAAKVLPRKSKSIHQLVRPNLSDLKKITTQEPKPVETPAKVFDQVKPVGQSMQIMLHDSLIRRPTVMLNHMSPLQVLQNEGKFDILQYRTAIVPAAAFEIIDYTYPAHGNGNPALGGTTIQYGSISINLDVLRTPSGPRGASIYKDFIDPTCNIPAPADGAFHLSGRIIFKMPTFTDYNSIFINYNGVAIGRDLFRNGWTGPDQFRYADLDVPDHIIAGETYTHSFTNTPKWGVMGPQETVERRKTPLAIFEIELSRLANAAPVTTRLTRIR